MAPNRTPKPITQVTSGKAKPDLRSFLDLSPEIRNQIYSTFFKSPEDIRIHSSGGVRVNFRDDSIRSNFLNGMTLLSVCRQVYYETGTMFLSSNPWTIYRGYRKYRFKSVSHLDGAADFMNLLGSRSSMLKKLIIDVGDTCSPTCPHHRDPDSILRDPYLDIHTAVWFGDLVRELRRSPNRGINVDIVFTPHVSGADSMLGCPPTILASAGLQLARLSNVLRTLVQGPLDFLKYGSQIFEIVVARNGTVGCVIFGESFEDWSHKQHFRISENGDSVSLIPPFRPDTIMQLPPTIKSEIFNLVTRGPYISDHRNTATFDLDKRTCTEVSPVLASVCQELRYEYLCLFWYSNDYTIKMTSKNERTDFDGFWKLEMFWCSGGYTSHPWHTGPRYITGVVDCLLQFEVEATTTPESLRINITDLLRITSSVQNDKGKLSISTTGGKNRPPAITSISFDELRWYALVAFTEFLRKFPDAERKLCPKVWINGLCQVIQVEIAEITMDLEEQIRKYTP